MPTKQTKGACLLIDMMKGNYYMATQRGYFRSEMLRAIENIGMALTHLVRVRDAYEKDHPYVSQAIQLIGDSLVACIESLQKIHDSI